MLETILDNVKGSRISQQDFSMTVSTHETSRNKQMLEERVDHSTDWR